MMASKKKKPQWKLNIGPHLEAYPCGLKMGDRLILRRDLAIETTDAKPTGVVYDAGSQWMVLAGFAAEPHVIWLRNPRGQNHTWDAESIWESFDRAQDEGLSAE